MFGFFFFFKQKTAYEMRISDWSSDVCSSDLAALHGPEHGVVTVDAEQEGFAIKDRGDGIAPEDAAKMLEPFVRGPATNLPGSGLGLAIAASALAPQLVLAFERSDDGFCVRASPAGEVPHPSK